MDEAALRALMIQGLAGDSAAYSSLLRHLAERLRSYFFRRLFREPHEAEDLVQEVLIAIHTKRATYDSGQRFTVWVFAIARYKLIDHLRRIRRRGINVPLEDASELFEEAREQMASADVETLLGELPQKQRDAIRMVKLEELSVREAAVKAGMGESDVKVSVHRGLKKLSKMIKGEG